MKKHPVVTWVLILLVVFVTGGIIAPGSQPVWLAIVEAVFATAMVYFLGYVLLWKGVLGM